MVEEWENLGDPSLGSETTRTRHRKQCCQGRTSALICLLWLGLPLLGQILGTRCIGVTVSISPVNAENWWCAIGRKGGSTLAGASDISRKQLFPCDYFPVLPAMHCRECANSPPAVELPGVVTGHLFHTCQLASCFLVGALTANDNGFG